MRVATFIQNFELGAGVWVGAQVDPLVIFVGVVGEQCRLLYLQDSV